MPFFPSIQCFFSHDVLTMAPFFPKRLIEFLNKYLVIISASEIIHLVALHAIQLSYRYCSLDEMIGWSYSNGCWPLAESSKLLVSAV